MKVLYLTNIPSPYRVEFFNELGKLCELTVLYERANASDRNKYWLSEKPKHYNSVYLEGKNIGKDSAINFEVISYLKNDKYDIIVIGGYSTPTGMLAIEYCNFKKISFILNADGGLLRNENKVKYKIKQHYISKASGWLSTGYRTSNYLEHYGAKNHRIFSYPFTSIRKEDIKMVDQEEKVNLKNELGLDCKPTVISIGQFIHRKGFDILLDSWIDLDEMYNLVIIGGGEKREELETQILKLGLNNVTILNFVQPRELSKYYLASDLFVLPTREDIWGLVINEAMAHGLPVITTDKCISGEILISGNGYTTPVGDIKELSLRMKEILSDSEEASRMGAKSIDIIKDYTIEKMAQKHIDIFKICLNVSSSD